MKKLYFNLNSNLRNANLGQVEKGDSVELEVTLLQEVDYSNASFRLLAEKADNNRVEQKDNYTLLEEKITFKLKKEFLSYPGIVKMELNIADKGKEYTTSMFYIRVSDTINSNIIESIEDVETLKELEDYVKNANNTLNDANNTLGNLEAVNNAIIPNENKREEFELIRKQNEKNRNENERDRITAEKVRNLNEENRITTEDERIENEETRKNNELNRKTAENLRVSRENAREQAEIQRQELFEENESVRNENENTRIKRESKRVAAEVVREANEDDRILQELDRQKKEETRETNETSRVEAEKIREQQEENREQHYNNFDEAETARIEAEKIREANENARVTAESNRNNEYEKAEKIRNDSFDLAEKNRTTIYNASELERTNNEEQRVLEESKRDTRETARVEAEKERVTAEELRIEAENARVIAEQERASAEVVREEKINEFGSQVTKNKNDIKENSKDIERAFETINDNSFIPFTGENISVEHSKSGFTKDMQIEGMTLQNISPVKFNALNISQFVNFNDQFKFEDGYLAITLDGQQGWLNAFSKPIELIKPNTTYTFIVDVKENTLNKDFMAISTDTGNPPFENQTSIRVGEKGILVKKVQTKIDIGVSTVGIRSYIPPNTSGSIKLRYMLLEGDYTQPNSYIPSYFEGIKSVGEKENKIIFLSNGKNLFKSSLDDFINGILDGDAMRIYYKLKPNTQYTCSSNIPKTNPAMIYFNGGKADMSGVWNGKSATITTDINGKLYISLRNINYPVGYSIEDFFNGKYYIQLEEGTQGTSYEPYKVTKKEILLPFSDGLKGIENFKDTIEIRGNDIYALEKIIKVPYQIGDEDLGNCITDKVNSYKVREQAIEHKITDLNSINLETFKDITYVSSENEIQPKLSFKAPVDIPKTISSLRNANTMLIAKNVGLENKNTELEKVNNQQNKALKELNDTTSFLIEDSLSK